MRATCRPRAVNRNAGPDVAAEVIGRSHHAGAATPDGRGSMPWPTDRGNVGADPYPGPRADQTLRTRYTISRMTRTVPNMPPPIYMSFSSCVMLPSFDHGSPRNSARYHTEVHGAGKRWAARPLRRRDDRRHDRGPTLCGLASRPFDHAGLASAAWPIWSPAVSKRRMLTRSPSLGTCGVSSTPSRAGAPTGPA